MESQKNRDKVLNQLRTHLAKDRARTKVSDFSRLGLVELTRHRVRASLFQSLTLSCAHGEGGGRGYTRETVVRKIERALNRFSENEKDKRVLVRLHPVIALNIFEKEPNFLRNVGRGTKLRIALRDDPLLREDEFRILSGAAETDVTLQYASL